MCHDRRTEAGGLGLQPPPPPWNFSNGHFRAKKKIHIIFGQNHLIFGQAMDEIFGQLNPSPPPPPKQNWSRTPMCVIS